MRLLNLNRAEVDVQADSLVAPDQELHEPSADSTAGPVGERSGPRAQLDSSFRRITLVGAHQSTMRRSGSLLRPGRVA